MKKNILNSWAIEKQMVGRLAVCIWQLDTICQLQS